MKPVLFLLMSFLLLAACSTPKSAYKFDYYDYNSGRKQSELQNPNVLAQPTNEIVPDASPLSVSKESLVASAEVKSVAPMRKTYNEMTRVEKKEVRKAVKTEIKKYLKAKKDVGHSGKESKALDYNLKMAIIFGAIALTLSFFGGITPVFWVASVIALVIGVVFFIKWIAEQ